MARIDQPTGRNRILHYAVLASLALHALVLFGFFPELIDTARRAASLPPLIARLMAPEPVLAPPAAPVAAPLPLPNAPPRELKKPVAPALAPTAETAPAAPAQPALPAAAAAAPAPAATVASSAPALDEQSADRYRMELIAALARMIKDSYPPQARDNNWEGDVLLGVVVRANGNVSITVKRSSRFGVLDEKAVAVVRQAAQEVPVPPSLRGRESPLKDLLVQYRLTD